MNGRRGSSPPGWPRAGLVGVALVLASAAGGAEPTLVRGADGALGLGRLPPVLERPAIRDQLTSGLTTSFLVEVRQPGLLGRVVGAARIDVRYELWDEVYLVAASGGDGERRRLRFPDLTALESWWRQPELILAPSADGLGDRLRLRLRVLPFSASEQRDAQAWLTDSLGERRGGAAERTAESSEDAGQPLDRLFRVLLATSIGRGTLLEEEWEVGLPAGDGTGRPADPRRPRDPPS